MLYGSTLVILLMGGVSLTPDLIWAAGGCVLYVLSGIILQRSHGRRVFLHELTHQASHFS